MADSKGNEVRASTARSVSPHGGVTPGDNDSAASAVPDQEPSDALEWHNKISSILEGSDNKGKINKAAIQEIRSHLAAWAVYQARLEGRIQQLEAENDRLRKQPAKTYAGVAAQLAPKPPTTRENIEKAVQKLGTAIF